MSVHDPMLDGITRWHPYTGPMWETERGLYVAVSDLPALLARVREDERGFCDEVAIYERGLSEGQRDEREACIAAVSAPTLHDDACCSNGCTLMHSSEWEATRRIQIALGFPLSEEPPPPYRCDGSCNCTAAAFIAAIRAREEKP